MHVLGEAIQIKILRASINKRKKDSKITEFKMRYISYAFIPETHLVEFSSIFYSASDLVTDFVTNIVFGDINNFFGICY